MKLNHNSLSAKLYRWFYGTEDMPSNLCPYFWKLVTAVIFGLPVLLITTPHLIVYHKEDERSSFSERLGVGMIVWFMLFMAISMLSVFVALFGPTPTRDTLYMHMVGAGVIGWCFGIGIGGFQLFKYLKEKWENRGIKYDEHGYRIWEPVKEKTDNVIVEMVKAKYNKYCPKIDWKNENAE